MDLTIASPEREAADVRTAFEPFFRANFAKVAKTAALIAGDAGSGQDLAQEAFLSLYESWDGLTSEEHARNFVYKVAINRARSSLRRIRRLVPLGPDHAEQVPAPNVEPSGERLDVIGALARLPHRQRACVVLVDLEDMDSVTVGLLLGISANTVRVHLMRGRTALRGMLDITPLEGDDDEG